MTPMTPRYWADFNDDWDYNDPAASEAKFRDRLAAGGLAPERELELKTQIARALGLQSKFEEAHALLDEVQAAQQPGSLAEVRYLLERGRVLNSSKNPEAAMPLFLQASALAQALKADFYTVDALHMLGIAAQPKDRLAWNQKAISAAELSDEKGRGWLASLYNNTGWALFDEGRYAEALDLFDRAIGLREQQGDAEALRIAHWCVGRTLRALGRLSEALAIQRQLEAGPQDGFVYEELAECLHALGRPAEAAPYFAKAHELLAQMDWIAEDTARLERLQALSRFPEENSNKMDSIEALRPRFHGRIILPADGEYDTARQVFYSSTGKRPAAILRPADANDVIEVVRLARESGQPLAVRSGGHSAAGHGSIEGGLVLDLADLREFELDADAKTVWAGAGLTAGEFTKRAAEHGLTTGFGDTGSVGIGGITLGGGVGYLVRKYGLAIDNLLAADVVTASGELLRADAETNADLFWALRGGGGNFGVVTRFQFKLHPVDQIYGGMLILPATAQVISGFMEAAQAAPEELSTIANVMPAPPMPFLPAELHGQLIVFAMLVYAGDEAAGERAVAPFRELAAPLADMLKAMHYQEIYEGPDGPHPVGAAGRNFFMDEFTGENAETILKVLAGYEAPVRVAQLRVLGGAYARVPALATAYAHRARRIMVNVACLYEDLAETAEREAWVTRFADALRAGEDGVYVNFLADEGAARVREAYPGFTWQRLQEIKGKYDPSNLFRHNQNIPPR
jgi:FAD/FMN-containing dehydrogenase/tetratricopeptide (TPR) repeat protein